MTRLHRPCAIRPCSRLAALRAHADIHPVDARSRSARAGAPLRRSISRSLNDSAEPLAIELPAPLHVRLETASSRRDARRSRPSAAARIEIAPRQFVRVALHGTLPAQRAGLATLTPTGLDDESGRVADRAARPALVSAATRETRTCGAAKRDRTTALDRQAAAARGLRLRAGVFPRRRRRRPECEVPDQPALSGCSTITAALARRLPWIDDLYLSFSQTSLWDLGELSKPFTDSSYRPRLFYANYDLARYLGRPVAPRRRDRRRARVERQGRRRIAQLQHAVRAADAHVRRSGRLALLLRAADPQLHRRDDNPDLEGLSRLRRLAVRRRQQGRARFLGDAAQGRRAATTAASS